MKKALVTLVCVMLFSASLFAQSWQNQTTAPGATKKWCYQVLKDRITKADSAATRVVGSDTTVSVKLGKLPARSFITGLQVYVAEAFNQAHGSKADSVSVGGYYDIDLYMEEEAVSSTGVKTGDHGSIRYVTADSTLYLYFLKRGTILGKTGDVCVGIEYLEFPR